MKHMDAMGPGMGMMGHGMHHDGMGGSAAPDAKKPE